MKAPLLISASQDMGSVEALSLMMHDSTCGLLRCQAGDEDCTAS